MNFKTKNDISYFKFLKLSENITDDKDVRHILEESYKVFKPKNINRLAAALECDGKLIRRFKLDLDFKEAGRFIDADTYRGDGDTLNMLKSILVPKYKLRGYSFKRYKVEDISLREAEYVLQAWDDFLADLKFRYEYIYNPPIRANIGENTQGSIERKEFAEHYGGYAEMTYLMGGGKVKDFKEIWSWDLDYFLFWGEYFLRKRDVENIK
jgi:hypothetical protein